MEKDHPLLANIKGTRKEKCRHCGKLFGNRGQHEQVCSLKPHPPPTSEAPDIQEPPTRKPEREKNLDVMEAFKNHLRQEQVIKESTQHLYINGMLRVLHWWENRQDVQGSFSASKMLDIQSLDDFTPLPSITPYLNLSDVAPTTKAGDIKAYLQFCR